MAFEFAYRLSGGAPTYRKMTIADTVVLSIGEMVNLESGEVDSAATSDTALLGIAVAAADNTDDGVEVTCIIDHDAVYRVTDANARVQGATLDIASGALGVTTSSNADLIVVQDSSATEPTLVTFNQTHYLT